MAIAASPEVEISEGALLRRAQAGEAEAFCVLMPAYEARLLRQAYALCREESLAEDLVEEAFVEAWRSLPRYDGSCRLSTWLYAILLHRYQKAARRARSRPVPLSRLPRSEADTREQRHQQLSSAEPTASESLAAAELAREIRRQVGTLPPKHQQVVLLRFFEDASLPEIASALGCSVGTVKSRLHHALRKLRQRMVNPSDSSRDTWM